MEKTTKTDNKLHSLSCEKAKIIIGEIRGSTSMESILNNIIHCNYETLINILIKNSYKIGEQNYIRGVSLEDRVEFNVLLKELILERIGTEESFNRALLKRVQEYEK